MAFAPWLVLVLLAGSVALTLLANWLVIRRWWAPSSLGEGIANLLWIAMLFFGGLFAARYSERLAAAYLMYGLLAFLLSLLRAWLYRRSTSIPLVVNWPGLVRQLTYLVGALTVYLALSWLLSRPVQPFLLLPLALGALLPGLSRWLPGEERRAQPMTAAGAWRTPATAALLALVTAPLVPLVGATAWSLLLLGFVCHLVIDLLHPPGVRLLWPLRHKYYRLTLPPHGAERWLPLGLAIAALLLVWAVDFGPAPGPAEPVLSYEQAVSRYYSLRGRNRVLARIEGSWQATGRRWGGSFEILNASGESFLLLDSYTGRIFTAGRGPGNDFYLSSISLAVGDPIRVKPVEVHLVDQFLAESLPVLYQMQREPGLLYIFASGDLLTAESLPPGDAANRLAKIEADEPGHYTLRYLTAAELIALASVPVDRADLVIFATYTSPDSGPTVTPLPSPEVVP
jgi:membrane-bound metal-dependent hydrolase YbcI (DUF457 family)